MPPRSIPLTAAACVLLSLPAFGQSVETVIPQPPPTVFADPALVQRYQASISPADLAAQLFFFSSDFFEGRETTTRGQKLAAYYLAAQYRKLGLEPRGTAGANHPYAPEAYFQQFTVHGQRMRAARLSVSLQGDTAAASIFSPDVQDDQAYLLFGSRPITEGRVVFAGYGISDDDLDYDDYVALNDRGINVAGKWLLIFRDEPLATDSTSLLPTQDGGLSVWSRSVYQKLRAAYRHAFPKGFLIVGDVGPRALQSVGEAAKFAARGLESVGSLSLEEDGTQARLPVYMISSEMANKILSPSGRTVSELKKQIDTSLRPVVFELPGVTVTSRLEMEPFAATTENVLAFIEGSDPVLKNELVVVSSHYDHIGIDPSEEGDQINNGADDDGSGTVTTLEIAEAFMRAKREGYGPRRSILFLNVSGEEKGLLGSEYYADKRPVLPLENTVADLNIDMIGRHDPTIPGADTNYVYIIGSNLISEELHEINVRVNDLTGVGLNLNQRFNSKDDPNQFYARSDHWNFGKHGIPFIFFFTGTHEDYHRPGDEATKIDYDRMARIGRLIFATAWQVANQDTRPPVTGAGFH